MLAYSGFPGKRSVTRVSCNWKALIQGHTDYFSTKNLDKRRKYPPLLLKRSPLVYPISLSMLAKNRENMSSGDPELQSMTSTYDLKFVRVK